MTAASLSLLKGGKKNTVADELEKAPAQAEEAAPEAVEDETVVEVDDLSAEELDALVAEQEIETPAEWSSWDEGGKRQWLKEQFDEAPDEEAAPEPEPVKAEEPKSKAKPKPEPKTIEEVADANGGLPVEAETKAEEPAPKPKKAKGKAVAVSTTKEGEIVEPDVLQDLVHEIENMKEKQARDLVSTLTEQTEVTFFKLGGVLSVIQANGWYEPYASFREFVEKEHGLHYRKATYWIEIYNRLSNSGVPWAKVSKLGWTKLKEIARVLTIENVDEWVKVADEQNTITLIETVKNHLAKDAPKAIEDQTSKTVTTITFKAHEDQKETIKAAISKAKEQSGTQVDTVALEYICMDFMGGQTVKQKLQKMGIEAALKALEDAFPNAAIEVTLNEDGEEAA
jgi:hypothetical protein